MCGGERSPPPAIIWLSRCRLLTLVGSSAPAAFAAAPGAAEPVGGACRRARMVSMSSSASMRVTRYRPPMCSGKYSLRGMPLRPSGPIARNPGSTDEAADDDDDDETKNDDIALGSLRSLALR